MTPLRIRALLALILMIAAFAGAQAWRPTRYLADMRPKVELETMFPKAFGDWKVDEHMPVQIVSPDQAALLNKIYNQTLSRTYVNPKGERIMLSVAYGGDQSDGTRAHRPEVCYPAQGFQLLSSRPAQLSIAGHSLRVRQLVAKQGGRVEPITYWVMVGDRVVVSGTEQKLAQLKYSTHGVIPDGLLVRISNIDSNADSAATLHAEFISQLNSAMTPEQVVRVFGANGA